MGSPKLTTIAEGVRLCAVQTGRFKTCEVHISMAMPLTGDVAARALVPYLLRRSCRKYPDFRSLNGRLDALYGAVLGASVSKKGEMQVANLVISAIDDRFALDGGSVSGEAMQLLLDLLFDPKLENGTFCAEDIEKEKRLLLERKHTEDDEKRVYAKRRLIEFMCADELYSLNRYGTDEEIESLTPERIYAAWREMLERAVIQVVMVSSGTGEEVETALRKRFETIERHVCPVQTQFVKTAEAVKYLRETQPLKQGILVMGFRCGMDNVHTMDPEMMLAIDLFGGGTYSKLFTVVREQMSLCYYCSAQFLRDKGMMLVVSGIETENEEKAKQAILAQLQKMQNGEFSRETFDMAVRSLCDSIRGYTDSPDMVSAWYASQIFRDDIKSTSQRIEEIQAVRFEDIQKAAEKITPDAVFMLAGTGESADA